MYIICHLIHDLHINLFGDSVNVAAEEPGVGDDGVLGEGLDPGPRHQGGPGLVEGNVAVRTDSTLEYEIWQYDYVF